MGFVREMHPREIVPRHDSGCNSVCIFLQAGRNKNGQGKGVSLILKKK